MENRGVDEVPILIILEVFNQFARFHIVIKLFEFK